jgi:predicted nucleic acid-binding Zn ribbon protein
MTTNAEPGSLNDALRGALDEFGMERKIREQQIFLRWKDIVGQAIANNSAPLRLRDGKLWIQVPQAVWRQELSMMRSELAEKINSALGCRIVEEIILR